MTNLLSGGVGLVARGATESEIFEKKDRMLRFIRAADNKHKRIIEGMSGLRGLKPMLSSTRHQFKIGISKCVDEVGVAATMGHASVEIHSRNYGLERGGSKLTVKEKTAYKLVVSSEESRVLVAKKEHTSVFTKIR